MANQQQEESPAHVLQREIAGLIVSELNLKMDPGDVGLDDPLYAEGLGLDSIDMLELALVLSKHYGIQLRSDSPDNERIFQSLRSLAGYVAEHRTK